MGLFDVFKKRDVPSELPSLSIEEDLLKKSQQSEKTNNENLSNLNLQTNNKINLDSQDNSSKYKPLPVQKIESWNAIKDTKNLIENEERNERGFFKELIKDLTKEISSDKLDLEYKEKILGDDIVNQMKSYWEKQKPEIFLQNAGQEVKEQLMKKAENLNELEKDWQSAYFALISKEEKIRQEEKELKQMVSELIGIYEKSLSHKARMSRTEKKPHKTQ